MVLRVQARNNVTVCRIATNDGLIQDKSINNSSGLAFKLDIIVGFLWLEEFYSYTEKIQQKRTRKTKQNKGKLCTANNYIQ